MMYLLLVLFVSAPGEPDAAIAEAQKLYGQARYEAARERLEPSCDETSDVIACERLRGCIEIALGNEAEARAAFSAMVIADPSAELGPDYSPKLQALFQSTKEGILPLAELAVETPAVVSEDNELLIEVVNPPGVELLALTAYVASPGQETFDGVQLVREGEIWTGAVLLTGSPGPDDTVRYFLVALLPGDIQLPIGSRARPREASLVFSGAREPPPKKETPEEDEEILDLSEKPGDPAVGTTNDGPDWMLWGIVGGAAVAVIAGSVIAIVLLTGGSDEPGTINVHVAFDPE